MAEFLGEEEKTLIDFIIDKVEQHSPPSAIAEELQDVLEKDAEMFTIKMWRVLLFELIQARPSVRVVVPWVLCVPGWAGGSDWSTHRSNRPTLNPPAATNTCTGLPNATGAICNRWLQRRSRSSRSALHAQAGVKAGSIQLDVPTPSEPSSAP